MEIIDRTAEMERIVARYRRLDWGWWMIVWVMRLREISWKWKWEQAHRLACRRNPGRRMPTYLERFDKHRDR